MRSRSSDYPARCPIVDDSRLLDSARRARLTDWQVLSRGLKVTPLTIGEIPVKRIAMSTPAPHYAGENYGQMRADDGEICMVIEGADGYMWKEEMNGSKFNDLVSSPHLFLQLFDPPGCKP